MMKLCRALSRLITLSTVFFALFIASPAQAQNAAIALLVPDNASPSDPLIAAWTDAAKEEGWRLELITDSQFTAMASGTDALAYQGVILPDQSHTRASQALVNAVINYVNRGGKAMLVYDFAALDENGFYPASGPSRLSALAGVDYILYSELLDQTTGLGPLIGSDTNLRRLQVPPGKSMAYSATSATATVSFLPASPSNPGGLQGYNHQQQFSASFTERTKGSPTRDPGKPLRFATAKTTAAVSGTTKQTGINATPQAISGYVYGYLTYPSYVTRGTYGGETLLYSPYHGLVAGITPYGTAGGKTLFVNTPLTYLKGATDAMLMHGFMQVFAGEMLGQPKLSRQPDARAGLVFDWHVDYGEAIPAVQTLQQLGVWDQGPYSIDITAGPDTVVFGDGLGVNLPNNPTAQQILRDFVNKRHQVGSHGGWIHDYYGLNVNETNQNTVAPDPNNTQGYTFQDLLILNKQAVEAAIGNNFTQREYSSPEGNNPKWALNWLESTGVVGFYYTGHTGTAPTRNWREGVLMNPSMWSFPVSPFGKYATFEEFQDFNVPKTDVNAWYKDLIDFSIKYHTSRLIYAHPPGAADWPDVLTTLLNYATAKGTAFKWYTMPELADFMTARSQVSWNESVSGSGKSMQSQFTVSHPGSLAQMAWLLPKKVYGPPIVTSGQATVSGDSDYYIVTATGGNTLTFISARK